MQRVPVILDTDLGDDIDDTWALGMLLGCPEVDLRLVTAASDDTPVKTRLIAKVLDRMGRPDLPIGTGPQTSRQAIYQKDWLGDYGATDYPGTIHEDGVGALIAAVHACSEPVTICAIGPLTNLAAALERDPSIARRARVVAMAGSIRVGLEGSPGRIAEWNVRKDIAAAQAVFAAPWEITLAPLDSCGDLRVAGLRYAEVAASANPRAHTVMENYAQWGMRHHHPADASSILFDTVAAYLTFAEDWCRIETLRLRVTDTGETEPVDGASSEGRSVRCATALSDRGALEQLIVDSLTR